ncbi:Uncharacterised protein [Pannonibacter phragmitetus]|uniref:Uncharacterized protein n=1 Tax=Pannonibacter phragmitetus TaxID=121719 RepID=A0A378ZSJ8_9HYPH|nr:Uncharacterised protein [Pannonibacter phragmitetus]
MEEFLVSQQSGVTGAILVPENGGRIMKLTINIDDELLEAARDLTGTMETAAMCIRRWRRWCGSRRAGA